MKRIVVYITLILITLIAIKLTMPQKIKTKIKIGDKIPDFTLQNQNGENFSISSVVGKQPLVIYFYPKDDTPGCTKEACTFRDNYKEFTDLNAIVIGISSDDVASHKKFSEKYDLPCTLLADIHHKVRKLFGVPSNMLGLLPGRVTYIADKKGIVRYIFNNQFKAKLHIQKALDALHKD